MANVLMRGNRSDTEGVQALAREFGAHYTLDPTITPMMDGNTSVLRHPRGCERILELFPQSRSGGRRGELLRSAGPGG